LPRRGARALRLLRRERDMTSSVRDGAKGSESPMMRGSGGRGNEEDTREMAGDRGRRGHGAGGRGSERRRSVSVARGRPGREAAGLGEGTQREIDRGAGGAAGVQTDVRPGAPKSWL